MSFTKEELLTRNDSIGGSEVGIILGLNNVGKSNVELFYEKLGVVFFNGETNEKMIWGTVQEALIADMWQYWEGNSESLVANFESGRKVRKCQRLNKVIRNPQFPHLSGHVDRMIQKNQFSPKGVLEVKNSSGYALKKWDTEVPPSYRIQLMTYLMIKGESYGELCFLVDGSEMRVVPIERDEEVCNMIAERTTEFWQRVLEARKILAKSPRKIRDFDDIIMLPREIQAGLQRVEPEANGTEAYENFIKERYKDGALKIDGNKKQLELARKYDYLNGKIGELNDEKLLIANTLRNDMKEASELNFGEDGRVMWKADAKGVRRFGVYIKPK